MRIAITGSSGFVGRQLVPLLIERGAEVLLIGRDTVKLRSLFPQAAVADYSDLATAASGFDALLHLAVINNDKVADAADVERVNVDLPFDMCRQATAAAIRNFIFISSLHALDLGNASAYAVSKRRASERLVGIDGIAVWTLYLPAVVGDELAGKLAVVNRLPHVLRGWAMQAVSSLKPTLHIARLADAVMDAAAANSLPGGQRIVADGQGDNPVFSKTKRFIDIAFALTVIVLAWWAMAIIWLAIRLASPGPGVFRQRRVGRNQEEFTCLKFRTMYLSAPNAGTHEVSAAAVTPLGHFLRRTKLDELPQVINILRNDMSLVGPRPCLPTQHEMIAARQAQGVFEIKPGITGLAQIRGIDMSEPAALAACDREYLQLQSLLLDFKIIIKTARGSGSGDNVATLLPDRTPKKT